MMEIVQFFQICLWKRLEATSADSQSTFTHHEHTTQKKVHANRLSFKEGKLNKHFTFIALFIGIFMFFSCASGPVAPPQWRYEKEAITLTFQADPRLNLYNDTSHTLQLCVYQLKDPNGFNQLTENEDGLYTLLECSMFDASVANFRSVILRPGQNMTFAMDRAEGAKYVGLAAGYADIEKNRITRLIDIPVITVKEGGAFSSRKVQKPDIINLNFRLGPYQIETGTGE